jgi:hypothetical protein
MLRLESIDATTMTVLDDYPCTGCGYNLHTLPVRGECPECSRPVVHSLSLNQLVFADPKWLRRVRRGVKLLIIVAIGPFVIPLIILVAQEVAVLRRLQIVPALLWGLVLLFAGLSAWGAFQVTAPGPGFASSRAVRYIGRVSICLMAIFISVCLVSSPPPVNRNVAITILVALGVVATLCVLASLRRLARGAAERAVAAHCTLAMWLLFLCAPVFLLGSLGQMIPVPVWAANLPGYGSEGFLCTVVAGALVCYGCILALLPGCHSMLTSSLATSRQVAATEHSEVNRSPNQTA